MVPVENTTEGGIIHTFDTFLDSDLKISAEIAVQIHMCLLARAGVEMADIERVYSLPVAAGQCRRWLASNLPRATVVDSRSTADGARLAHDDARGAAVAAEIAARLYDLTVVRRNIEDSSHNMTRFLVVGREQAEPTGRDKTSMLLVTRDEPGILYRVLGALAERGLNMTKIREPALQSAALGIRLLRRCRWTPARRPRGCRAGRGGEVLRVVQSSRLVPARRTDRLICRTAPRPR